MVSYILPKAFENGADVVADRKLVIEFTSCSSMLNIWKRKLDLEQKILELKISLPQWLLCNTLHLSPTVSSVMTFKHQALREKIPVQKLPP